MERLHGSGCAGPTRQAGGRAVVGSGSGRRTAATSRPRRTRRTRRRARASGRRGRGCPGRRSCRAPCDMHYAPGDRQCAACSMQHARCNARHAICKAQQAKGDMRLCTRRWITASGKRIRFATTPRASHTPTSHGARAARDDEPHARHGALHGVPRVDDRHEAAVPARGVAAQSAGSGPLRGAGWRSATEGNGQAAGKCMTGLGRSRTRPGLSGNQPHCRPRPAGRGAEWARWMASEGRGGAHTHSSGTLGTTDRTGGASVR